jgi:hypothetical protein
MVANALAENPYVQELFSVLKENDKDTAGLTALLGYVKQMEDFVKSAEGQIVDMNCQIGEMKEIQKHPIKAVMQNTCESLEKQVTGIKAQLNKIRANIVEACKNVLTAVRDKGITVLDKLASFFHIKQACEKIQKDCTQAMAQCDKSVAKIEQFGKEYHETGLHLKNMFRVAIGKEVVEKPKENGVLAKSMCAPYKAERKCMNSICKTASKAAAKLEELGKSAAEIRQEREERSADKSQGAEKHLAEFEAKAKQQNAATADNVLDFKPKAQDEVVMA